MGDPLAEAQAAVYARLSTDVTFMAAVPGGLWDRRAPVDVETYPLATLALIPTRTDYTFTGPYRHVMDLRLTVLDKAEAMEGCEIAVVRAYSLLQDAGDSALAMTTHDVLYCRRQGSNQMSPVREGEQFQQWIDAYRLEVRPA